MSFYKRNKKLLIGLLIILVGLGIFSLVNRDRNQMSGLENWTGKILTPIGSKISSLTRSVKDFFINLKDIKNLREENQALVKENAELLDKNIKLEKIVGLSEALKLEYDLMNKMGHELVEANIIGKENNNWFDRFTIDVGSKDGVKLGASVITPIKGIGGFNSYALVGRVYDLADNWAKIISIVDDDSKLAFNLNRTGDGGIIEGTPDRSIEGYFYDEKIDVKVGDRIMTSGLGEVYKKDIYIGDVEQVLDEDDLVKRIVVSPAINFKKINKVFLIVD